MAMPEGVQRGVADAPRRSEQPVGGLNFLTPGRVHEVLGPMAPAFALSAATSREGRILWIGEQRMVRALRRSVISAFVDPERLTLVQTHDRAETLWAAEEALRCRAVSVVVTQITLGPDLFESRRLQIAAHQGGGLGLVLINRRGLHP